MRRLVGIVLGLVVVVAALSAWWTYVSGEHTDAELVLVEVSGDVAHQRGAGPEAQAKTGTVLDASDRVVTGQGAAAVLGLGAETRIRLGAASTIQVRSVDPDEVRLELEDGALHATVRPGSGALRIGSRGREVIATNATFDVGARGDVMQVSAAEGELVLSGVDATRLAAGEQATIVGSQAAVGQVPEGLLLEVAWPPDERTRARMTTVKGATAPGATVRIVGSDGEPIVVRADGSGEFVAEVPLFEGQNAVTVAADDLLGRSVQAEGRLPTRDTEGPAFQGSASYGQAP